MNKSKRMIVRGGLFSVEINATDVDLLPTNAPPNVLGHYIWGPSIPQPCQWKPYLPHTTTFRS